MRPTPRHRAFRRAALTALAVVLLAATPVAVTGCVGMPALATALTRIADAEQILNLLQTIVDDITHSNQVTPEQQVALQSAMTRAWVALNFATRAVNGAKSLSEADTQAAFTDFRNAYSDLSKLLQSVGVISVPANGMSQVLTGASRGRAVPSPLALGEP